MKRKHDMPFGAEVLNDGTVRFRLWAPKANSVALRLATSPRLQPMSSIERGWFGVTLADVLPGAGYQFVLDDGTAVPDPASRYQPAGVHGPSEVIDPVGFEWQDVAWRGRPWREAVLYELHVGTFSPEGTFAGAQRKLDYLADLGVTAIELMPLSSFPGNRNWGYDGVLPFAPPRTYGTPEELKRFVEAAHARSLMVILDVVYNHFGPEGNYLWLYAPQFFSDRHHTPWGKAINFDGPGGRTVRDYFIHNALYWLEEYHFDGLRFDAVHSIADDSSPDFLSELAATVRNQTTAGRHIHLILENDHNAASYLRRDPQGRVCWFDAQWNDDAHHAAHVLLTGETSGYYSDYSDHPIWHLGRCLAEGFSYQGELSRYRHGQIRGEPSRHLPLTSFVGFLQNHDQIGNRALGERLIALIDDPAALKAAATVFLLAPSIPLLFMGEEFGARTPFLFFCDFGPDLAAEVTAGRRAEFAHNGAFCTEEIPDPNLEQTFLKSKLDWDVLDNPEPRAWLGFYRELLARRRDEIVPRIEMIASGQARFHILNPCALRVHWPFQTGGGLEVFANFSRSPLLLVEPPAGRALYKSFHDETPCGMMPPLSAAWFVRD